MRAFLYLPPPVFTLPAPQTIFPLRSWLKHTLRELVLISCAVVSRSYPLSVPSIEHVHPFVVFLHVLHFSIIFCIPSPCMASKTVRHFYRLPTFSFPPHFPTPPPTPLFSFPVVFFLRAFWSFETSAEAPDPPCAGPIPPSPSLFSTLDAEFRPNRSPFASFAPTLFPHLVSVPQRDSSGYISPLPTFPPPPNWILRHKFSFPSFPLFVRQCCLPQVSSAFLHCVAPLFFSCLPLSVKSLKDRGTFCVENWVGKIPSLMWTPNPFIFFSY